MALGNRINLLTVPMASTKSTSQARGDELRGYLKDTDAQSPNRS